MKQLIGIYQADSGFAQELWRTIRRLFNSHACWLSYLSHSPKKPSKKWQEMEDSIRLEFGYSFTLAYRDQRSRAQRDSSKGREPCVLIDTGDGGMSMILDWNDLELASGNVSRFEQILRSKLLMY